MVIRPYVVRISSAKMPTSVKATYKNIAVCETTDGEMPKQIRECGNVVRIVSTWYKCNVGKAVRSAYVVALAEANAMARALNSDAWGCQVD